MTKYAHRAVCSASDTPMSAGKSDEQKPKCWSDEASSRQYPTLTGTWEDSAEEDFEGFYDATEECPAYGHDFDCRRPYKGAAHVHTACHGTCMLILRPQKAPHSRDPVTQSAGLIANFERVLMLHELYMA